jgi:Icc protein
MEETRRDRHTLEHDGGIVRVVQLTDTHLCRERGGTLLGMDTDHSLQSVIDQVKAERTTVDLLLGTGDLSDGGALEAYQRLQTYFDQFDVEGFWLPGNHDDRGAMAAVDADGSRLRGELRVSCWQILLLDSQVPGEVGGRLGRGELARLEASLESAHDESLYTLVCLHHQPVPVGCEWLDEQMVADADDFFGVLDRFPGVRGVLWGHVHQQIDRRHESIDLMASPSTCVQFAPGTVGFKADDLPPGYRWLDLHPDGRIETAVSRVWDVAFTVELDSGGYL